MKAEAELEQAQRVTEDKKHKVHDELIRKSAMKEVTETERAVMLVLLVILTRASCLLVHSFQTGENHRVFVMDSNIQGGLWSIMDVSREAVNIIVVTLHEIYTCVVCVVCVCRGGWEGQGTPLPPPLLSLFMSFFGGKSCTV